MSIRMETGASRLTVLGSGWNNSSINSGSGLTENGNLWDDISKDLGYDSGKNTDWDKLAEDSDLSDQVLYGDGLMYVPIHAMGDLEQFFKQIAVDDSNLLKYAVAPNDIKNLYSGLVTQEREWDKEDAARPHKFAPGVYYIQRSENEAVLFQEETFWHKTADGGNITVNDKSITIRSGSSMKVYWSTCNTHFDNNYLKYPYSSYPIEYVCWQCLWGSFRDMLISDNGNVKSADQTYPKTTINEKEYYIVENK